MEIFDKEINKRFVIFCHKHVGKTQAEIAEICECTQKHISTVFNFKSPVSLNLVMILVKKKKLNFEWLSTGKGNMLKVETAKENLITNIAELRGEIEILKGFVSQLQKIVKKLASDYYAKEK